MNVLDMLVVITVIYVLGGLILLGVIGLAIAGRRDEAFRIKYQDYQAHRRSVLSKPSPSMPSSDMSPTSGKALTHGKPSERTSDIRQDK